MRIRIINNINSNKKGKSYDALAFLISCILIIASCIIRANDSGFNALPSIDVSPTVILRLKFSGIIQLIKQFVDKVFELFDILR